MVQDNSYRRKKRRKKKAINLKSLLTLVILLSLGCIVGVAGIFTVAAMSLPAWDPQQLSGANSTLIYDDQNEIVAKLHAGENRTEVSLDQVPGTLKQAFIAVEDQDFYEHHGINFKGIARAIIRNIQSGDLTGQGASTITQQLARNAFLSFDKEWERKIKEAILAFKLEMRYSKDEILEMYMNKINLGAGAYGVQAAANTYFGKDVSELNLAESSLIAGLAQRPNGYNPFQYYERAKSRQQMVLNAMVKCNYIDQDTAVEAYNTPLNFNKKISSTKYGFFIDAVFEEAVDILEELEIYDNPENAIYRSGLHIYTTMNSILQEHAEQVYSNNANFPNQTTNGEQIQSAAVVFDHSNGEVKALIGGRSYEQRRGFNRATSAFRQPGSSIKPIAVYSPALERGYMPFYVLDDSPISFKIGNTIWSPKNYDFKHRGLITMRTAVQWSINTYAIQLLDRIGIRNSFDFAESMGLDLVDTPGTNDLGLSPLSLGSLTKGASPMQMAAAYGTIANGGVYIKPHLIKRIVDAEGKELYSVNLDYKRVMSEQTSWLMTDMLQTVVASGTGTNARLKGIMTAGKTGTTEENKDSWFCGFTPTYSAAVWMGYDRNYPMNSVFGGGFPAQIFRSLLQKAHEIKGNSNFNPPPQGIVRVSICPISGKIPSEICPGDTIVSEYTSKEYVPTEVCDTHEQVYICPESNQLAGRFCPHSELKVMVRAGENSHTPNKIPLEGCTVHTGFSIKGVFKDEVYICTDPSHDGKLYQANIPNAVQTGGCPEEYIQKIVPPGHNLPRCPIEEHQVSNKKPRQIIDDLLED
ncbi:MAG: PBP1A family penicillin-binding protein [Syntrophomonadaceae bacterium]|nr:PBP1A family penicillin-binding protein [Syntrophomonadaceae bacterium]